MAETPGDQKPADQSGWDALKQELDNKYEKLYQSIADILEKKDHQRVLLTGEAGIGKTRLAKAVEKHVTGTEKCFLTIWLHLNRTFKDELSLYENIASQLCVYSDFEETEVDDRDEDEEEEKKPDVSDLQKKIIDEIVNRRKEFEPKEKAKEAEKRKKEAEKAKKEAEKAKKEAEKAKKEAENKKEAKKNETLPAEDNKKDTSSSTGKPYLLLVLDDEGKTSEAKVMKELKLWEFLADVVIHVDEEMKKLKLSELAGDPSSQKILEDSNNHKTLEVKILAITKAGGETESKDEKSEAGEKNENGSEEKSEGQEEANNDKGSEGQEEANNDKGSEGQEGANVESEIVSDGGTESQEKDNKGKTKDQETENVQDTERDGKNVPSAKDGWPAYDVIINSHTKDVSQDLRDLINTTFLENLFRDVITNDYAETFADDIIVKKSKNSPAAIVVLAKSLKSIMLSKKLSDAELKEKIKQFLKEKIDQVLSADRSEPSGSGSGSGSSSGSGSGSGSSKEQAVNPIMHLSYELLETCDPPKHASEPSETPDPPKHPILDCFWHTLDFFEHCGCVYYRDLITQWMLEGYFDPVRSVEKAYQQGHSILMELINRGMLKIQENNVVVPEMAMINLIDPRRHGHLGSSRLAFSRVYRGDKKKGIGKITQIDDMIKTVQAKKGDKITTLLVSGDCLRRVTPTKYFKKLDHLEVLGLFEPALEPFIPPLSKLSKLRVLVIRDCDLLNSIEKLKVLNYLNALEISGASSLNKIPDDFFEAFPELQSLHLSGLQITSSPSSISKLKELHCLIIKNCPLLEDLPNIQELVKLEVIDISGALSLQTCFDNAKGDKKDKSKNKNFYHLQKLQLLDFSESQIERLPLFQDAAENTKLKSLTRLLLRNCRNLRRLPSLKPLTDLQILDLSGTTSLVEMLEVCFEDKKELKTLNLSETNLNELATTINELSGLKQLLLRDCLNLDAIPNIEELTNLEVLDVSGSTKLVEIKGSFKDMSYLREVNLRGTKVEIPELPTKTNIHCLKRIIRADGKCFEGATWSIITKNIERDRSLNASSSDVKSEEIEETKETLPPAPRGSDVTEKRDIRKERLLRLPKENALCMKIPSILGDPIDQQEVLEINETNKLDENELANAKFVSVVDCTPTRLTSIFKKTTSVKCCWIRMCTNIKELFSEVDEESLKSLETLTITNLPLLETIGSVDNLENLKNLTLECCPKIITIFPKKPTSLKVLNTKHCEKLEKVVEGVELSTLNLAWKEKYCPKFEGSPTVSDPIISDYVIVEPGDYQQSPPPHE